MNGKIRIKNPLDTKAESREFTLQTALELTGASPEPINVHRAVRLLARLRKVSTADARILVHSGLANISQVAHTTPTQLVDHCNFSLKKANTIITSATSFYSDHGIFTGKLVVPRDAIYIDIENCMDRSANDIWMIGLLHDGRVTQFSSPVLREVFLLQSLSEYLQSHPKIPLMCYSTTNYDFRYIIKKATEYGINELLHEMASRPLIDLGSLLNKVYFPPGGSLKLKTLAKVFSYPLSYQSLDGNRLSRSILEEIMSFGKISPKSLEIAAHYNADDVKLLPYLIGKFEEMGNVLYCR